MALGTNRFCIHCERSALRSDLPPMRGHCLPAGNREKGRCELRIFLQGKRAEARRACRSTPVELRFFLSRRVPVSIAQRLFEKRCVLKCRRLEGSLLSTFGRIFRRINACTETGRICSTSAACFTVIASLSRKGCFLAVTPMIYEFLAYVRQRRAPAIFALSWAASQDLC